LDATTAGAKKREESIQQLAEIGAPAVDPLCEALGDPRIPVRRAAACALCKIGDERALGPILRVLYGDDYWTGHTLLRTGRALGVPGVREELMKIARHGERGHQYWAILALAHAKGDREVFGCLNEIFHDTGQYNGTRQCALGALCALRPGSATNLVTEALGDPEMRRSSGWAWWIALKDGLTLPIVVCLGGLGREIAPNSRMMAGRLALRHGQEGRRALLNVMRTGSRDQRAAAALALSREEDPGAFEVLVSELIDGYRERKWARIISRALVAHYPERLQQWSETREGNLSACPEITWVLAKVRMASGTGTADDIYRCGSPTTRAAALRKLATDQGPDFLPELRHCLREGAPRKVAREAFRQMSHLGDAAMSTVDQMLESEHWTERKAAYCLLRRWGKLTPEQRKRGEKDSHVAVRHAANWHPDWRKAAEWHEKWRKRIGKGGG
jgi:HEAT repeat protein